MNLKQAVKWLLGSKSKPNFPVRVDKPVKFAFECGGIRYYEFVDINEMGAERAQTALSFFNEMQMKCTREFLLGHCEAVKNIINSPRIDMIKLVTLHTQLLERLQLIFEAETFWKLCSVVFFDETENPYRYDHKYGMEKIQLWKQHAKAEIFFLEEPIKKYLPSIAQSQEDFLKSLEEGTAMTKKQWASISSILSPDQKKSEWYNTLELLMRDE